MSTTRTTLNKRMRLIAGSSSSHQTTTPGATTMTVKTTNSPLSKLATHNNNQQQTSNFSSSPTATMMNNRGGNSLWSQNATRSTCPPPSASTAAPDSDDFMQTGFVEFSHPNTIIHLDIDCFYAQVEEIRDPSLREKPLGIQQKNCLVTCNYKARAFGVKKLMSVGEARQLCPELVLVKGEDLTPYRQMSSRVFEHITRKYPQLNVERLGMDENFVDVTRLIGERMDQDGESEMVEGCVWPKEEEEEGESSRQLVTNCLCGCDRRLAVGTHIARDLRESLFKELGITTCAGVAHNKMLAKLAGALNKPNNQTVVVPTRCKDLMVQLKGLRSIPGIGQKTESLLHEMHVTDIESLQRVDQKAVVLKFGPEMAKKLKDWSHGVDGSSVRPSNFKPKSIGLEDSCHRQPISVRQEIEEKFRALLQRLLNQVAEDGRIPVAIKMTLRKFDAVKRTSHRETRQANILPTLFHVNGGGGGGNGEGRLTIVAGGQEKVLQIVMRLFERVIDLRLPFNVTLLGLAFSKFQERRSGGGVGVAGTASITSYLLKKKDIEVQSVTSLTSDGVSASELPSPVAHFSGIGRFYREQQRDMETMSDTMSVASDVSEPSEIIVEPSPKKSRLGLNLGLMAKRRCFGVAAAAGGGWNAEPMDCASPSKLRVAELRLNSIDRERENSCSRENLNGGGGAAGGVGMETNGVVVPKSVDPEVFKELPSDLQNELIRSWAEAARETAMGSGGSGNGGGGGGLGLNDVIMRSSGGKGGGGGGEGEPERKKSLVASQSALGKGKGGSGSGMSPMATRNATAAAGTGTTTLHRYFIANK